MDAAEEKKLPKFYCPECGVMAKIAIPMFTNRVHRLELPIYICNVCGLFYIDEKLIKKIIRRWRRGTYENESLESLCDEYIERLSVDWDRYRKAIFRIKK